MTVSILLLLITTSGIFISAGCFVDAYNDIKKYIILLSSSMLLLILTFSQEPISKLKQAIECKIFSYGMIILNLLLSIQGILQYLGIIQSNNSNFTISGSFENLAGFIAIQTLLFIISFYNTLKKENNKYLRFTTLIVSFLAFITIIITGSRCGILATLFSMLILSLTETNLKGIINKNKWIIFLLILLVSVLIIFLYYLKEDSANGRVLIWRISLNMIAESPIWGFGYEGFLANYMNYQAEYLATHKLSSHSLLADNINHPFNEYIKLTVEYGILGLLFAIYLLYIIIKIVLEKSKEKKGLGLSLISTVLILSLFSYPFNYTTFAFIVILLLILVLPIKEPWQNNTHSRIKDVTRIIIIIFTLFLSYDCYYNYRWNEIYKRSLKGESKRVMPYYKYLMSKISYNPYFLYNYSVELNYIKQYAESNKIAELCTKKLNDYDVQLLLADNYFHLQKYEEAINEYKIATNMIPSRFLPLGKIMNIYLLEADTISAINIAKQILSKKIKIPSNEVYKIIQDAESTLKKYNKETI